MVCPTVATLSGEEAEGSYFLLTDHANLSSQPSGTGVNFEKFGNRFYDISTMHNKETLDAIKAELEKAGGAVKMGQAIWANGASVPNTGYAQYAKGIRNEKINLEAVVRQGISEVFALCHWKGAKEDPSEYKSAMVGVVSKKLTGFGSDANLEKVAGDLVAAIGAVM